MILLLLACAPPETDLPHTGNFPGQYAPAASAGPVVVVPIEENGRAKLILIDEEVRRVLLDAGGRPDRLALSGDGRTLAFVWGRTGLASVWTLDVAGGEPVQRTNLGRVPTPGRAPPGFEPAPEGPPRIEAAWR